MDSSGLSFFYTGTQRMFDAGVLFMGHVVTRTMIIPPGAEEYTVLGQCSSECTQAQVYGDSICIIIAIFISRCMRMHVHASKVIR